MPDKSGGDYKRKLYFYSRYNPPPRVSLDFRGEDAESMTKQEFKEECDINVLMARYLKSGVELSGNPRDPLYGDFSQATDFHEAQNVLLRAKEQFEGLSAKVRERFGNSPEEFLKFVNDPKNLDEADRLGMLNDAARERLANERKAREPLVTPPAGGVVVEPLNKGGKPA